MGNKNSAEFTNLDNDVKEKSLYSFDNVRLIKTTKKNKEFTIKNLNKNDKGIKYKLKLYPTNLTLKNKNMCLEFSYYNIQSWASSNMYFFFNTLNDTYYCKVDKPYIALEIANCLKKICYEIYERNK